MVLLYIIIHIMAKAKPNTNKKHTVSKEDTKKCDTPTEVTKISGESKEDPNMFVDFGSVIADHKKFLDARMPIPDINSEYMQKKTINEKFTIYNTYYSATVAQRNNVDEIRSKLFEILNTLHTSYKNVSDTLQLEEDDNVSNEDVGDIDDMVSSDDESNKKDRKSKGDKKSSGGAEDNKDKRNKRDKKDKKSKEGKKSNDSDNCDDSDSRAEQSKPTKSKKSDELDGRVEPTEHKGKNKKSKNSGDTKDEKKTLQVKNNDDSVSDQDEPDTPPLKNSKGKKKKN